MNKETEIAKGYCDNIHSRHASEGGGGMQLNDKDGKEIILPLFKKELNPQ